MEAVKRADDRYWLLTNGFHLRITRRSTLNNALEARAISVWYPGVRLAPAGAHLPLALWQAMCQTDTFLPWYYQTYTDQFVRIASSRQYWDKEEHATDAFRAYYIAAHGLSSEDTLPNQVKTALTDFHTSLICKRANALVRCDALIYPNIRRMQRTYCPRLNARTDEELYVLMGNAVAITLGWKAATFVKDDVYDEIPLKHLLASGSADPLWQLFYHWEDHYVLGMVMRGKKSGEKYTELYYSCMEPFLRLHQMTWTDLSRQKSIASAQLKAVLESAQLSGSPQWVAWKDTVAAFSIRRFEETRLRWTL